jgi:dethiobiotin synthetase
VNLFFTGTDTGAGKTYIATRWIRALRAKGIDAVGMKPICCGDRDDAEAMFAACDGAISLNDINPVWLRPPVAPYVAAMMEERTIDVALILDIYRRLRSEHQVVIVEGVGGWRVPIRHDYFVSDLAADMGLPVAVVVSNRLGALNHTILTVQAIRARGIECAGLVLTQLLPEEDAAIITNRDILEEITEAPILCEVRHGQAELELPPQWASPAR